MLESVSWGQYMWSVFIALFIYYIGVIFIYYNKELSVLLRKKSVDSSSIITNGNTLKTTTAANPSVAVANGSIYAGKDSVSPKPNAEIIEAKKSFAENGMEWGKDIKKKEEKAEEASMFLRALEIKRSQDEFIAFENRELDLVDEGGFSISELNAIIEYISKNDLALSNDEETQIVNICKRIEKTGIMNYILVDNDAFRLKFNEFKRKAHQRNGYEHGFYDEDDSDNLRNQRNVENNRKQHYHSDDIEKLINSLTN